MNIFVLDENPKTAASMMCDKHVVKMIIESGQMLSACLDVNYLDEHRGNDDLRPSERLGLPQYPKAHVKHPCTMWVIESSANFNWLVRHMRALCLEYTRRYGKIHKLESTLMIYEAQKQYCKFAKDRRTPFKIAIKNTELHKPTVVSSYRNYYNMEKYTFAKWKLGNTPNWFSPQREVA
ncbi:MAG: hypothetical protein EBY41_00605 [Proteobacteria bacterium]|nr:hypothetical protein [Pseudomonadota bacterium]